MAHSSHPMYGLVPSCRAYARFGNCDPDFASTLKRIIMNDENIDDLNKDNCPTFAAFLEKMAAHNAEQLAEFNPNAVCPTCGKIHDYTLPYASKPARSPVA